MTHRTCTIDGCDNKHVARGYCRKHYSRLYRNDFTSLEVRERYATPEESFAARVSQEGDCLVWAEGTRDPNGYGQICIGGSTMQAHRYAWIRAHGPIPDALVVDHKCHNKACVKIEHLRLATRKQNVENVRGAYASNKTSGILGVSWDTRRQRWVGQVKHHGRSHWVGYFYDLEEAAAACRLKRLELFTHNDHDRSPA